MFVGSVAGSALVLYANQAAAESCFVFKETSCDQPTVFVFLDVKQPDLVGRGGFVPREKVLKKEKETGKQQRHLEISQGQHRSWLLWSKLRHLPKPQFPCL